MKIGSKIKHLPLRIPFFRNFISRTLSCLRIKSHIMNMKFKIFAWKLFEKTLHVWFQFNIETPIDDFHLFIKQTVLNSFDWNLEYMLYSSIQTIYLRPIKCLRFFEVFVSSFPFSQVWGLISQKRWNIEKKLRLQFRTAW